MKTRDFSVHPVVLRGHPSVNYLRVRADEGVIGVGRLVSVRLKDGGGIWRRARVVEPWELATSGGGVVWLELLDGPRE